MEFDGEGPAPEEWSPGDEACPSKPEEERPARFVTLPVGPAVGLTEVVAAAQVLDHDQAAWHPGMITSQTAEVIAAAAPGASLARVLEAASAQSSTERDQAGRIELIAACERMTAHLAGLQARFAQEFLDERGHGCGSVSAVHDEIAARLATTSYAAGTIITRAGALEDSPRLRAGLASGEVSARKVDVIAAAVTDLGLQERVVIEDYGCELAPTHTPPQLKKALAAAVIATDPAKAEARHEREVEQRRVMFEPAAHGMSWLSMYLPAQDGLSIYTCLDAIAATGSAGDERSIDARRADAASTIFTQIMASGALPDGTGLPTHHGRSPHLQMSVTAPVLAGDEHTPALLHGYGPICAGTARKLATQAGIPAEEAALQAPSFFKPTTSSGSTTASSTTAAAHEGAGSTYALATPPGSTTSAATEATAPSAPAPSSSPTSASHTTSNSTGTVAPPSLEATTLAAPDTSSSNSPSRGTGSPSPGTGAADSRPPTPGAPSSPAGAVLAGPCQVAPGVIVSLATHPGATWSERCELAERLGPEATMEQLDAIYGPARPWPDHASRSEDLAIWRELLDQEHHPPGSGAHLRDSGERDRDADWDWLCRYHPNFDPMRGLLPPPRPPELPDGTNTQELIAWTQRQRPLPGQTPRHIEDGLGLICTDAYAPSRRLRSRVIERDQTCRFPTCQVPAWRCQLDHITSFDPDLPAWAQTIETNLHALCAHHHQIKTAKLFGVERDPRSGITTWHSPTGHIYTRSPEHPDYTAIAHHLRDEYSLTLCEEDPVLRVNTERLHELLAAALPGPPSTRVNQPIAGQTTADESTLGEPATSTGAPAANARRPWPPAFPTDADPPF